MSPIQQMFLGVGAVATKIYVDDCFYTHAYKGNGSTGGQNITGSDFTPDLVWIKGRNHTANHILVDSVRGDNKVIYSNTNDDEDTNEDYVNSRFEGGFKVGNSGITNGSNETNVGWTWKKQEGFFDIVTYTGTGSARTVDHNLGCIPGMIIIKRLDTADNWNVYHRNQHGSNSPGYYLQLNTTDSIGGASNRWNDTAPTSTEFTVGTAPVVNANGDDFIAYVFAGGESTAATARSVDFDGSGDELSIADSADFDYGSGDFTLECWLNPSQTNGTTLVHAHHSGSGFGPCNLYFDSNNMLTLYSSSNNSSSDVASGTEFGVCPTGQWTHIAVSREGNNIRMFRNGINVATISHSGSLMNATGTFDIGARDGNFHYIGKISNFRVVKGTAVYTSSFKPPTEPLTNISGTTLLCCNNSSTTGSTVTPGTITANGDPTASTDSPFDDPAGFAFGDSGDQNVIKCGSYVGNGSTTGPEINLGWEPQWLLVKCAGNSEAWVLFDSTRGIVSGGNDLFVEPNSNGSENTFQNWIELTARGFKIITANYQINQNNKTYIFTCIRRSDGYVGKPPELGSNCFQMDMGNASSSVPAFDSGFPVDMAFTMDPSTTGNKLLGTRLTGENFYITNSTTNSDTSDFVWDSHKGCFKNYASNNQAWMWRRGKSFDVVIYKGNDSTRVLNHSLNAVPQMMWVWNVANGYQKYVYHSGSNQGSSPWTKEHRLNATEKESGSSFWGSSLPTSSTFNIGASSNINGTGNTYIAMLFANVDGISKCGYFTGSSSAKTLTVGFQARFFLVKRVDDATGQANWNFFDSQRGMASAPANFGEQTFTTPGTHTWTCPSGVSSVSVVCVGGGGEAGKANSNDASGGGGGALAYKNSISVTAGSNYTVTVGAGGSGASGYDANGNAGGSSSFTGYGGTLTAGGGGGGKGGASNGGGSGGSPSGHDGGGSGGNGGSRNPAQGGGGGAGGYSGNGGNGLGSYPGSSGAGSGGGGGGGYQAGGGGVGLGGEGASGASSNSGNNGKGGSGGEDTTESSGGKYGGGGKSSSGDGADGAVRIVWSTDGTTRSFPSTNVATYDDKRLTMNTTAKSTGGDYLGLTSTEIILTAGQGEININNAKYIYYAHA